LELIGDEDLNVDDMSSYNSCTTFNGFIFTIFIIKYLWNFSTYEKEIFTKLPQNWHTRALYTLWYISRMFDNGIFQTVPEGPLNLSNVLESL
jgi:hypothetical protein